MIQAIFVGNNRKFFFDLRFARRFAFQFDLGIVNGEVNVSRTNGKVTIAIFLFFFSGGDFSLVPNNIANSPRGK